MSLSTEYNQSLSRLGNLVNKQENNLRATECQKVNCFLKSHSWQCGSLGMCVSDRIYLVLLR